MKSHKNRTRRRFELEALEGRVALSHLGAVVEDGPHHNRGGEAAEVHMLRHGADDAANHDANDDKGTATPTVTGTGTTAETVHNGGGTETVHHHRRGHAVAVAKAQVRHHAADDAPGHK